MKKYWGKCPFKKRSIFPHRLKNHTKTLVHVTIVNSVLVDIRDIPRHLSKRLRVREKLNICLMDKNRGHKNKVWFMPVLSFLSPCRLFLVGRAFKRSLFVLVASRAYITLHMTYTKAQTQNSTCTSKEICSEPKYGCHLFYEWISQKTLLSFYIRPLLTLQSVTFTGKS